MSKIRLLKNSRLGQRLPQSITKFFWRNTKFWRMWQPAWETTQSNLLIEISCLTNFGISWCVVVSSCALVVRVKFRTTCVVENLWGSIKFLIVCGHNKNRIDLNGSLESLFMARKYYALIWFFFVLLYFFFFNEWTKMWVKPKKDIAWPRAIRKIEAWKERAKKINDDMTRVHIHRIKPTICLSRSIFGFNLAISKEENKKVGRTKKVITRRQLSEAQFNLVY